ncbi:MAG: methylated-DNA--[protein]-cysteine S-methyltransferase [candidate division NC10 bacterium]|nr:methylated-DNA--[protein]-cysteine S-methyltransferase [candidate division NC10 bacterium]
MTCRGVRERLQEEGPVQAVRAHLEACGSCRRWWEGEQALTRRLATALRPLPAPASLLGRVVAAAGSPPGPQIADLGDRLLISATEAGITGIRLLPEGAVAPPASGPGRRWAERAAAEIREYLAGERAFFDVPGDLRPLPAFSRRVLEVAARIPFGDVRTYGEVARSIGAPRASRAVGNALGSNPVPLVIPCHRVIRGDGTTGGYGLGPDLKGRLLSLEASVSPLVGSASTGVVCRRGCDRPRRPTPEPDRVHFARLADARAAGFRPCIVCRPYAPTPPPLRLRI